MATVTFQEMEETLCRLFRKEGMRDNDAALCARVISESSFDGVLSHGIAKVPGLVDQIRRGVVRVDVVPGPVASPAAGRYTDGSMRMVEPWDGRSGVGIVNAAEATDRAVELARNGGIGCVALRNTNHWFRAGTYGYRACDAGFGLMAWTNTVPNMPAWGGRTRSVGNNPLVFAVPHPSKPVVLDMALSQFALGKMTLASERGERLPVPGGYDEDGNLTDDPGRILHGGAVLPSGFWKGSGLALLLDLFAAALSGGNTTADLAKMDEEREISQLFIAFDFSRGPEDRPFAAIVDAALASFRSSEPVAPGEAIRSPGENTRIRRARNRAEGLDLDAKLWERVRKL